MDHNQTSPEPPAWTLSQMRQVLETVLMRNYWLMTHLVAHDALLQPIARRQLDYDDLILNAAEGTKKQFLAELLDLGVDETQAQELMAEAKRLVLGGTKDREAN